MTIHWSRAEPLTLHQAARAMYEQGASRTDVLRAVYGVEFPREASLVLRDLVIDDDNFPLGVSWRWNPWQLMMTLEQGGPYMKSSQRQCEEDIRLFEWNPDIVLLSTLEYHGAPLGSSLIGYDLGELRAGRSTVVGLKNVPRLPAAPASFTTFGSSLLDVLHELVAGYLTLTEERYKYDTHEDVDSIKAQLEIVEALQQELRGEP